MQKYTDNEVQEALAKVNGWALDSGKGEIYKQFKFNNFLESIAFVNKIAPVAEELEHHPDITINYNKVTLSVVTHDAGGLTDKDFTLAARANDLGN